MNGPLARRAQAGARLGEAPLWLPDRNIWLWLDLYGRQVRRHDPATGEDRVIASGFAEDLACIVRWTAGAALLASGRGFYRLPLDGGGAQPLPCPIDLPVGTIFNDGKVDRHGALWIGSSDAAETAPVGRLWRIAGGGVTEIAAGFVVSNGPAFSPNGEAAYFADTMGRRLLRFDLDAAGHPRGQATFATIATDAGYPDGMTVDSSGVLHVGHWDGARISRWSPEGQSLGDLAIPARNVTSLSFGGPQLRNVAVTTAMLFPNQPDDSALPWNGDLVGFDAEIPGLIEPALSFDGPA